MSKPNPFLAGAALYGTWKHINNGTKQAAAAEKLSRLQEDQLQEMQRQSELQSNLNEIKMEGVSLQRQMNAIANMQLAELEKQTRQAEIRNQIAQNAHELELVKHENKELRIRIKKNHEDIELRRRDCIFNIKKDLENINNSWDTKVEKAIQIINHISSIRDFGISTELSNSFDDKELIFSTNEDLKSRFEKLTAQLTEEETEDILTIVRILQVDEESLIFNAKFDLKELNTKIRSDQRELKTIENKEDALSSELETLEKDHRKHQINEPS